MGWFQRVHAENVLRISEITETLINKLTTFVRAVKIYSGSKLVRIALALAEIRKLVVNDIGAMDNLVQNNKQVYDSLLKRRIDHLLYFLDASDFHLDHIALRLENDLWYEPLFDDSGVRNYGWNAFIQAIGVFDTLRLSLYSIKDIGNMISISDLNDDVRRALPLSLWFSNKRRRTCEVLFYREMLRYKAVIRDMERVFRNWESLDKQEDWPGALSWRIQMSKSKITPLKLCANEYRDTITKALDHLSSIKAATEDMLNTGTSFDFETFQGSFHDDLKAISASGSWLHWQMNKYIAYNISKLELADQLLSATSKDDMYRYMENIFFKTDLEAISKLRSESRGVKATIQKWFVAGLGAISYLLDYFDTDEIEYKMRNISLWRQPIVDLRTDVVLRYSLNIDETWRTWPLSVSLRKLITPEGSQYISNILENYMLGINEALYEIQQTSLTTKDEAVAAIDVLWRELRSYKLQSQVDDNFVRLVKTDIA